VIFSPLIGRLADKLDLRWIVTTGLAIFAGTSLLGAFNNTSVNFNRLFLQRIPWLSFRSRAMIAWDLWDQPSAPLVSFKLAAEGSPGCETAMKQSSEGETMLNGWISLRVKDPKRVAAWYTDRKMLELFGAREEIGARALGSSEYGPALILIPGDQLDRPASLQLHLHVSDVDAEYERLKSEGVEFEEPPRNMPWGWRHAYTKDPAGHTVELCSPLPEAPFKL